MAGLFNRIFRPGKKRELEFSDQRSSFQRNEGFAEASGGLKSSMRRKGRVYEDDPLVNPTAPYHYDIQPQRQRGPRSLPPRMLSEYSPNESPSSSNDVPLDRSFQSEVQPHRRRSKYVPSSPNHRHHESRRRRHRHHDSDSENAPYNEYEYELDAAMKQIQKYKLMLGNAITDKRNLEREREKLQFKIDEMRQRHKTEIRSLNQQLTDVKQQVVMLQNELASYRNYQSSLQSSFLNYQNPPFYYSPQRMPYNFQTPPNPRFQMNNTNTGNTTFVGSTSGFRPVPPNGSGESLAHMSATTTVSHPRMPGMPFGELDEVKVFRKDENDTDRPLTNLVSSFEITSSGNLQTSISANSSPETKSAEKTPVVNQKIKDLNLARFEKLITKNPPKQKSSENQFVKKSNSTTNVKIL